MLSKKADLLLVKHGNNGAAVLLAGLLVMQLFYTSCDTQNRSIPQERSGADTIYLTKQITDTVWMDKDATENPDLVYYVQQRLPEWFLETSLLEGLFFQEKYIFDNRLNPLYLEEDFNGDGHPDIAFPIEERETRKMGFAIVHGETGEVFIVGAGNLIPNGLSDDMHFIDIWKVNRELNNDQGAGEEGPLHLKLPSIRIAKSESGGGLVYWDGTGYTYFHQSC